MIYTITYQALVGKSSLPLGVLPLPNREEVDRIDRILTTTYKKNRTGVTRDSSTGRYGLSYLINGVTLWRSASMPPIIRFQCEEDRLKIGRDLAASLGLSISEEKVSSAA